MKETVKQNQGDATAKPNVKAHRQSGGGDACASAETSESPDAASATEIPLCSVQRSCSPLSSGFKEQVLKHGGVTCSYPGHWEEVFRSYKAS